MRLDTFLCQARFVKSRSLAQRLIEEGHLRLDGRVCDRAHGEVRAGAVLSFPLHGRVRVVRVLALPVRRGPPAEARACYEDLGEPMPPARPHATIG